MLFTAQEKPCGAGVGMRCEGLVDRAAWRMSGADEVRVGSWNIFFCFDFQLFITAGVFGGKKNNKKELDFLFYWANNATHRGWGRYGLFIYLRPINGAGKSWQVQSVWHVIYLSNVRRLLTLLAFVAVKSCQTQAVTSMAWHANTGICTIWLPEGLTDPACTVDTTLSGIFASVWEICPHSDSGCKMCPFSNETQSWSLLEHFWEHVIWMGLQSVWVEALSQIMCSIKKRRAPGRNMRSPIKGWLLECQLPPIYMIEQSL